MKMNKLLELINAVKVASKYNEVELWGQQKAFDKLRDRKSVV